MPASALAVHGRCRVEQAERLALQWFDDVGLNLCYSEPGVLIAWVDDDLPAIPEIASLAVELRLHPLSAEWVQVCWSVRHPGGAGVTPLAADLLDSLRRFLDRDARWEVDAP